MIEIRNALKDWKEISEKIETDLETFSKEEGENAEALVQSLKALHREFQALQSKFETVSRDREIYKRRWETARDENAGMRSELQEYDLVKRELGPVRIQNVIAASKAREAAEKAARQEAKQHAHSRPGQDAR